MADPRRVDPAPRRARWRRELGTLTRFGLVGLAATAVHMGVAWVLLHEAHLPVMGANAGAFACAFAVSFLGHYHLTFGAPGRPARALARFLATGIGTFALNNAALALLLRAGGVGPYAAIVLAIAVLPLLTFVIARSWAFAHAEARA